jgi:hypothetical protein
MIEILIKIFRPKNFYKIITSPKLILVHLIYKLKTLYIDLYLLILKKKIYKYNIIFIAGMPISASTLLKNMLGSIPFYFTRFTPMPKEIDINKNISNSAFKFCPKNSYTLFKTHLNPTEQNIEILDNNNVKKIIVSYRDLRDVALSRYYRILEFPKKIDDPRYVDYKKMEKEDAINHSINVVCEHYNKWINGWIEIANKRSGFVHFCKFEDLVLNRKEEFKKILEFYEINLDDNFIDQIIIKTQGKNSVKKNISDSALLPWALSSNFRKGKIGEWKKEFSEKNIFEFKSKSNSILIKLGYELNDNW